MFTTFSAVTAAAGGRWRIWVWLRNMPRSFLATKVKMQQDTQIYLLYSQLLGVH